MLLRSIRARLRPFPSTAIALMLAAACGGAGPPARPSASPSAAQSRSEADDNRSAPASSTEAAVTTFVADFSAEQVGSPFNVFGALAGKRRATGGPEGLWLQILSADKAWDAIGVRTAKVKVDGDFDLRGAFRGFLSGGNGSTKLIVVDAASTRGEAAYVERIRIDGKDLYKFGGEIEGSLENWGFVEAKGDASELRLERRGNALHAYQRMDLNSPWAEFAPPQPAPKTMPRVLKVGVKLSAEAGRAAEVTWTRLLLDGNIIRVP
jgi:hypothetical protein